MSPYFSFSIHDGFLELGPPQHQDGQDPTLACDDRPVGIDEYWDVKAESFNSPGDLRICLLL
jgi:hypothetical protein